MTAFTHFGSLQSRSQGSQDKLQCKQTQKRIKDPRRKLLLLSADSVNQAAAKLTFKIKKYFKQEANFT